MFSKLVIIDNRVADYQKVIDALRTDVGFVILDYDIDTYDTLKEKIKILDLQATLESVALVSHGDFSENYKMLENSSPSQLANVAELDPKLESWNGFVDFFSSLNTPIIDLLGCSLYMNDDWRSVLNTLESQTNINFRASVDDTGNLYAGGNWILESDNVNIKDIYFTENIEEWMYLLGSNNGTYSAVVDSSGRIYTCGWNSFGKLGLGLSDSLNINIFTMVNSISNEKVIQISCGINHMACITDEGKLYTWGRNENGQLGLISATSKPTYVTDLSNKKIISVACGNSFTICLDSSGRVYSCGNSLYIARNTTDIPVYRFGQITDLSNRVIVQISSSASHIGLLDITGKIYLSGSQYSGRLGNNLTFGNLTTLFSPNVNNVHKIICGSSNTAYIKQNGDLYTFASNLYNQIFPGKNTDIARPDRRYYNNLEDSYNTNITDIICSYQHIYVFKNNNVFITGKNPKGYIGFGSNYTLDISRVPRELDISALCIYSKLSDIGVNTFIIDTSYNLYAVGYNKNSDLGIGNNIDVSNRTIINPTTFRPPTNSVELLPDYNKKQNLFLVYKESLLNSTVIEKLGIYPNNINYTYRIVSVRKNGEILNNYTEFDISSSTGVITRTDRVTTGIYYIDVEATSGSLLVTATATININTTNPSRLNYSTNSVTIKYGDSHYSVIPTINLGESTSIIYSIENSVSGGSIDGISIDSDTGIITCNNDLNIGTYNLKVIATSSNNVGSTFTTYTVIVNPLPPSAFFYSTNTMTINYKDVSNSLAPNIHKGGAVGISYEISGGNIGSIITISNETGVIYVNKPTIATTYNLIIIASNSGGSATTNFTIKVESIPPKIVRYAAYDPNRMIINYGDSSNSVVPLIDNGGEPLVFEINTTSPQYININRDTGIINVNNIKLSGTRTLTVTASNSKGSVTGSYTIEVKPIAPSALLYTPDTMTIKCGDTSNSLVPAIDNGGSSYVVYNISGGNIGSVVTINSGNGRITVTNPTTVTTYNFVVTASNSVVSTKAISNIFTINIIPNKPDGFKYDPSSVIINYGQTSNSYPIYSNTKGNTNFNYTFSVDKTYLPDSIISSPNGNISTTDNLNANTYNISVESESIGGDVSTNLLIKVNTSDISYNNISATDIKYKESFDKTVITGNFYNPYNNKPVNVTYTMFYSIANQVGVFPVTAYINGGDNYKLGQQITTQVRVVPLEISGYSYRPSTYTVNKDGSQNAIINDTGDTIYYSITNILKNNTPLENSDIFSIDATGKIIWNNELNEAVYEIFTDASNSLNRKQANFILTVTNQIAPFTKYLYSSFPSTLNYGEGYTSPIPDICGTIDFFKLTVSSTVSSPSQYVSINNDGQVIFTANSPVGTYNITAEVNNNAHKSQVIKTVNIQAVKPFDFQYIPSSILVSYKDLSNSALPNINRGGVSSVLYSIRNNYNGISINKNTGLITINTTAKVGSYLLDVDVSNSFGITSTQYEVKINPDPINNFTYTTVNRTIDISGRSNTPVINDTGEIVSFNIRNITRNGNTYTGNRISIDNSGQIRWTDDISSGAYIITVDASNSVFKTTSIMRLNISASINSLSYTGLSSIIEYGTLRTYYLVYSGYVTSFTSSITRKNSNNQYELYDMGYIQISPQTGTIIFAPDTPVGDYKLAVTANNRENSMTSNITISIKARKPMNLVYDISHMIIEYGDISSSILPNVDKGGVDVVYYKANDNRILVDSLTGKITTTNLLQAGTHVFTIDVSNNVGRQQALYKITVNKKPPSGLIYDPSFVEIFRGQTVTINPKGINTGGNTQLLYTYDSNGTGFNPNIILNNGNIITTPLLPIGTYNLVVSLSTETGVITTSLMIRVVRAPNTPLNAIIRYSDNFKEIYYDTSANSNQPIIVGDIQGFSITSYNIRNVSTAIINKVFIDSSGILEFEKNIPLGTHQVGINALLSDARFISTVYTLTVKSRPIDLYLPHIYDIYGGVERNDNITVSDISAGYIIEDASGGALSVNSLKPILQMKTNIDLNNIQPEDLPDISETDEIRNAIKDVFNRDTFKISDNELDKTLTFREHYNMAVSNNILGNKEIELPSTIKTELEKDVSNFNIGEIFVGGNGLDDIVVRRFLLKQLKESRPERFIDEEENIYTSFPIQERDYIILRIKTESAIVKDVNTSQTSSINKLLKHLSRINQLSNYTVDNVNNVIKVAPKLWSVKLKLGA